MSNNPLINVFDRFDLTDEEDIDILLFRDAHFNGDFDLMIKYLEDNDVCDFRNERIEYLQKVEISLGHDLAPLLLSTEAAEQVAKSRQSYIQLRTVYEDPLLENSITRLIADLILSEANELNNAMDALIIYGNNATSSLIKLIQDDRFYSPFFPGYGKAPVNAIICLGKIADPSSIPYLFSLYGKIEEEASITNALYEIGDSSKQFLLKILSNRPIAQDTTHAALALAAFAEDKEVISAVFSEISLLIHSKDCMLLSYLSNICCDTDNMVQRSFFKKEIVPKLPEKIRNTFTIIVRNWH
ncbi:hypothetical protein CLAVI_000171 [Candidatus Clavichlamydia salmonicola]|uniref:hypothetical protein n=1 Tax=Candidatus Clavichlamydia salmonicola TaxID=469812 RepID=UPI0018914537|nr:hypothetical protein [Candidatus Clavichlamydia salmonicola]MBF5050560.1 hypothetical protein [Candidatus Clavichlamydia salmonicola]